jgi:hypothetical protein
MKNIKKNEQFHLISLEQDYFCFLRGNVPTRPAPVVRGEIVPFLRPAPSTPTEMSPSSVGIQTPPTLGIPINPNINPTKDSLQFSNGAFLQPQFHRTHIFIHPDGSKFGWKAILFNKDLEIPLGVLDSATSLEELESKIPQIKQKYGLKPQVETFTAKSPNPKNDYGILSTNFLNGSLQIPKSFNRQFKEGDLFRFESGLFSFKGSTDSSFQPQTRSVTEESFFGLHKPWGDNTQQVPLEQISLSGPYALKINSGKPTLILHNFEGKTLESIDLPESSEIRFTSLGEPVLYTKEGNSTKAEKVSLLFNKTSKDASKEPVKMVRNNQQNANHSSNNNNQGLVDIHGRPLIASTSPNPTTSQTTAAASENGGNNGVNNNGGNNECKALPDDLQKLVNDADSAIKEFKKRKGNPGSSSEHVLDALKIAKTKLKDVEDRYKGMKETDLCFNEFYEKLKGLRGDLGSTWLEKLFYNSIGAKNQGDGLFYGTKARLENSQFQGSIMRLAFTTGSAAFGTMNGGWGVSISGGITGIISLVPGWGIAVPISTVGLGALNWIGSQIFKPPTTTNPNPSASPSATPTTSASPSATATPTATASPAAVIDTTTPNLELKSDSEEVKTLLKTLVGKELPVYTFQNGTFTLTNQKITLNKTIVSETGILPSGIRGTDVYLLADTSNMLKVEPRGFVVVIYKNPQIK